MKIEIMKVEHLEFQAIDVLHIYPHSKQKHHYRRYKENHWCHFLGDLNGWHQVFDPAFMEDAYQVYIFNERKRKAGQINESK